MEDELNDGLMDQLTATSSRAKPIELGGELGFESSIVETALLNKESRRKCEIAMAAQQRADDIGGRSTAPHVSNRMSTARFEICLHKSQASR
jgi:hypothetical protein